MANLPRVSIIIANHNYGEYIVGCIESALNQTVPLHICIVDDGSQDDSVKKINKFFAGCSKEEYNECIIKSNSIGNKTLDFIQLLECNGASEARNIGIRHVWKKTDVFGILDADDEYYKDKVRILLNKLFELPMTGVVYADYDILNTSNGIKSYEYKEPYSQWRLGEACIVHSGSLIKKEVLEAVLENGFSIYDKELHGPATEDFIGSCEDYDLWIRIAEKFLIVHVPQSLSLVRVTGKNQSRQDKVDKVWQNNIKRILDKAQQRRK